MMVSSEPDSVQEGARWLPLTYELAGGGTLRLALRAMCVTRVGRVNEDPALVAYGHSIYGKALQSLQNDLYDPRKAYTLMTTSTCRVMGTYEVSCSKARCWKFS